MNWQVYIILCSDRSLYTGITTDLGRRLRQHATGQGAKYFRGRRPEKVLYLETGHTRSSAGRREAEIKKLTRADKWLLAAAAHHEMGTARENFRGIVEIEDFSGMLNITAPELKKVM